MPNKETRIAILTDVELKKTISRLTFEIIEKVVKIDDLLWLEYQPGVYLAEVFEMKFFREQGKS